MIRLPFHTSVAGWDDKLFKLKKSALANKNQDCDFINKELYERLHKSRKIIMELGESIHTTSVDNLVEHIKLSWDQKEGSVIKRKLINSITLKEWSKTIIDRKLKANKPGSAKWYKDGVQSLLNFTGTEDIKLYDITVTLLNEFQTHHESKGNSINCISSYLRAIRAIYNSAIKEDRYVPVKNTFEHYKIPKTHRTKKRAISKDVFLKIRELNYKKHSELWHTKNYALVMFNCRGMNFIDLAKLRISAINRDRLSYGRSKTGTPLSVKITTELSDILDHYTINKNSNDFIFPVGYDGTPENHTFYLSQRRRVNKLLKVIAKDAGIEETFTTYSIRHSWATIAKFMGISSEVISESLGHHSLNTTEIYLKNFNDDVLDDANDLIVS
ncbi:hypothetical protein GCM10023163_25290 [Aestuariibaculum suncheonense]